MRSIALALAAFTALTAPAQARCFDVTGTIMVERTEVDGNGLARTVLEPTTTASPGDHLVFTLNYTNARPDTQNTFAVTNPLPANLVYAGTDSPGELVSVDGGRTFGRLNDLRVALSDGDSRPAAAADVTHVRWVIHKAMASGTGGRLSFRAVMRDLNPKIQMAMR